MSSSHPTDIWLCFIVGIKVRSFCSVYICWFISVFNHDMHASLFLHWTQFRAESIFVFVLNKQRWASDITWKKWRHTSRTLDNEQISTADTNFWCLFALHSSFERTQRNLSIEVVPRVYFIHLVRGFGFACGTNRTAEQSLTSNYLFFNSWIYFWGNLLAFRFNID